MKRSTLCGPSTIMGNVVRKVNNRILEKGLCWGQMSKKSGKNGLGDLLGQEDKGRTYFRLSLFEWHSTFDSASHMENHIAWKTKEC